MRTASAMVLSALSAWLSAGCGPNSVGSKRPDAGPDMTWVYDCGHDDCDGDGYLAPIDCNDFDATINPEAYDFVGDYTDNDCDGVVDNPVTTCETIPTTDPGSPTDFVRAADLCAQRSKAKDGKIFDPLLRAAWGKVSGVGPDQRSRTSETKAVQTRIVSSFGQNAPRQGQTMVGLATGPWGTKTPRESPALDPPDFQLSDACADIPLDATDCAVLRNGISSEQGISVQDWAELTLWLRAPVNAGALQFDFAFFTTEFNQYWDAALNDAFFVLVSSGKLAGENVAKSSDGRGITVNSGFFQLCPASPGPDGLADDKAAALAGCVGPDGDAAQHIYGALRGTGYDGANTPPGDGTVLATTGGKYIYGGGTGWLTASFPIEPGEEFQVRFILFDTFDGLKDSAVLLDHLTWLPDESSGTVRPF